MLITFLRHATAEDHYLGVADAERALTEKGEKQVKRVAGFCLENSLIPGLLLNSPLLRAYQTAKILHMYLPGSPPPDTVDWLGMVNSTQSMLTELAALAERGNTDVWLVGHEPDFSTLIARLLNFDSESIAIKKASLTRLECDFNSPLSGKLLWSIPCSLMP